MKYNCNWCSKCYTNKGSLKRHAALCEILNGTTREKQICVEETTDLPSFTEVVEIVQMLAIQNRDMKEKLTKLERETALVTRTKLDAKVWLDENVKPGYININEVIVVPPSIVDRLFDEKAMDVFTSMIHSIFDKESAPLASIRNKMYYYREEDKWQLVEKKDLLKIFNKLHQVIMEQLYVWREKNATSIASSDTMSIRYNKTLMKLLNINFMQDATWSRSRRALENAVNFEVKNIIEYVIE